MTRDFFNFDDKNDLLTALFQPNINLFCILEKNGSFLKVNQGWTHILGSKIDDLSESVFLDFVHAEDKQVSDYAFDQLLKEGELLHFVNRYRDIDGHYLIISWCIHYVHPYLFVAGNDLTKFKSLESKLHRDQEELGKILPLDLPNLKSSILESLKLMSLLKSTPLTSQQDGLLKSLRRKISAIDSAINASDTLLKSVVDKLPLETKKDVSLTDSLVSDLHHPEINTCSPSQIRNQKILIVDDSILSRKLLETALSENYEIICASSGEEALAIIASESLPDLILLDIIMPKINGFEVCDKLQKNQATKDIPVIFLTSLNEHKDEAYGLGLGAIDYITKPFSIPIVKAKIKNYLALKYYQDILKEHTDFDQLTKIPNRRRFDETFSTEAGKARRYRTYLSLLLIDIDHFKQYNDTYGHLQGDCCLQEIATTLKNTLKRPGDFVARWGGEEFVCLLPNTDSSGAYQVAKKLKEAICLKRIPHKSSPVLDVVTVSIGVVTSDPQDSDSLGNLMQLADLALYEAKDSGRNHISVKKSIKNETRSLNFKKKIK